MTFPVALRSLLRQDPQVLMIGEVRDAQTAAIAVGAAMTGHLLMSTMHSGSPAGAGAAGRDGHRALPGHLQRAGRAQPAAGAKALRSLQATGIAQSLGRLGLREVLLLRIRRPALLAELVEMEGDLRKAVLAKADIEELEAILARRGHEGLASQGRKLVELGVTTQQEIEAVCRR